jgi:hypothetical protein
MDRVIGEFALQVFAEFLIKHRLLKALGLRQELFDIITSPYDFAIRHCG